MNANTMPAGSRENNRGDTTVMIITGAYIALSILEITRLLAGSHPAELTAAGTWTRALLLGWILSFFPSIIAALQLESQLHRPVFSKISSLKGQPLRKLLRRIGLITLPLTAAIICVSAVLAQFMV